MNAGTLDEFRRVPLADRIAIRRYLRRLVEPLAEAGTMTGSPRQDRKF